MFLTGEFFHGEFEHAGALEEFFIEAPICPAGMMEHKCIQAAELFFGIVHDGHQTGSDDGTEA